MAMKLSERLEKYRMALKQLDICQQELFEAGFITASDQKKIENFVDDEKFRVDKALKAFGIAPSQIPTAPPSLERAKAAGQANGG